MSISLRPFRTGGFEVDIRWRDAAGIAHRERRVTKVTSRTVALRAAEKRERELLLAETADLATETEAATVPTFAAFWPRFLTDYVEANRQKPSEVSSKESIWRVHLEPWCGRLPLDALATEHVQQLKGRLHHLSAKRVNNILTVARTLLLQAVEWKVIPQMPCALKGLKVADREMEYYDDEDYEAVVAAAKKLGATAYVAVLLAGDAGLRAGELRALRWCDADTRRQRVLVQQADWRGHLGPPKSWQMRRVPMTTRLAAALKAHKHLCEYVLVHHGERLTEKMLRVLIERAIAKAVVPQTARPVHRLRHTFGTRLATRGATGKQIQVLMGHKNLSTTERYMHLSPGAKESAIRLLEAPAGADIRLPNVSPRGGER